jgi:hypothetical protein
LVIKTIRWSTKLDNGKFGNVGDWIDGDVEIIVRAVEDQAARANYDAYSEYDIYSEPLPRATLVPPEKKSVIEWSRNDPVGLLEQILRNSEPAPVPVSK